MTTETTDEMIEEEIPRPVKRWTEPFRRFATWFAGTPMGRLLDRNTKVWQTTIAVLVVSAVQLPLVLSSIGATNQHVQASDVRANQQAIYTGQLVAYANASNTYQVCVAAATAFAVDRGRWEKLIIGLDEAFPTSDGTKVVTDILRNALGPDDPLTVADCPPPGDPPQPPNP